MSYSLEGWRILREAKKQGYQPVKGAEQQLPLTLILDRDGTVLFCHYGARACNPIPDPDSQYLISRIL